MITVVAVLLLVFILFGLLGGGRWGPYVGWSPVGALLVVLLLWWLFTYFRP
jgi:hypothetical protein